MCSARSAVHAAACSDDRTEVGELWAHIIMLSYLICISLAHDDIIIHMQRRRDGSGRVVGAPSAAAAAELDVYSFTLVINNNSHDAQCRVG